MAWYLLSVSCCQSSIFLYFADNLLNFEESLRGLFQTVSMITNTGIQFEPYLNWPVGARILFLRAVSWGLYWFEF